MQKTADLGNERAGAHVYPDLGGRGGRAPFIREPLKEGMVNGKSNNLGGFSRIKALGIYSAHMAPRAGGEAPFSRGRLPQGTCSVPLYR